MERTMADASAKKPKDMLNRRGAFLLARRLERYWHERGYPAARFWTEPLGEPFGTYEIYTVKCNLVGGLPPRLE